jgi:hypothetical protein
MALFVDKEEPYSHDIFDCEALKLLEICDIEVFLCTGNITKENSDNMTAKPSKGEKIMCLEMSEIRRIRR